MTDFIDQHDGMESGTEEASSTEGSDWFFGFKLNCTTAFVHTNNTNVQ